MKNVATLTGALALVILNVAVAQAETCYRLTPFADILRLNIETIGGAVGSQHENVSGNWISGSYTLPVSGARELNRGSSSVRRLGIVGTQITAAFGANRICSLDGIPGAAWVLTCVGGPGPRFVNAGTALTAISCTGLAPSAQGAEGVGPDAGDGPGLDHPPVPPS
jgi:hypothetical protein